MKSIVFCSYLGYSLENKLRTFLREEKIVYEEIKTWCAFLSPVQIIFDNEENAKAAIELLNKSEMFNNITSFFILNDHFSDIITNKKYLIKVTFDNILIKKRYVYQKFSEFGNILLFACNKAGPCTNGIFFIQYHEQKIVDYISKTIHSMENNNVCIEIVPNISKENEEEKFYCNFKTVFFQNLPNTIQTSEDFKAFILNKKPNVIVNFPLLLNEIENIENPSEPKAEENISPLKNKQKFILGFCRFQTNEMAVDVINCMNGIRNDDGSVIKCQRALSANERLQLLEKKYSFLFKKQINNADDDDECILYCIHDKIGKLPFDVCMNILKEKYGSCDCLEIIDPETNLNFHYYFFSFPKDNHNLPYSLADVEYNGNQYRCERVKDKYFDCSGKYIPIFAQSYENIINNILIAANVNKLQMKINSINEETFEDTLVLFNQLIPLKEIESSNNKNNESQTVQNRIEASSISSEGILIHDHEQKLSKNTGKRILLKSLLIRIKNRSIIYKLIDSLCFNQHVAEIALYILCYDTYEKGMLFDCKNHVHQYLSSIGSIIFHLCQKGAIPLEWILKYIKKVGPKVGVGIFVLYFWFWKEFDSKYPNESIHLMNYNMLDHMTAYQGEGEGADHGFPDDEIYAEYTSFKNLDQKYAWFKNNNWENFDQLRSLGFDEGSIEYFLFIDDLERFQKLISISNINVNDYRINRNFFSYQLPYSYTGLINAAAFFGSVRCFKYLFMNGEILINNFLLFTDGIYGGNVEIIHLLLQQMPSLSNLSKKLSLEIAIKRHFTDVLVWIWDNIRPIETVNALEYSYSYSHEISDIHGISVVQLLQNFEKYRFYDIIIEVLSNVSSFFDKATALEYLKTEIEFENLFSEGYDIL